MVVNDALRDPRKVLYVLLTQVVEKLAKPAVESASLGTLQLGATQLEQDLVICASADIRQHLRTVFKERAERSAFTTGGGDVPGSFIDSKCWYSQSAPLAQWRPSSWFGQTGSFGSILLL